MTKIERLAGEALSEYENGKTEPVDALCGEIPAEMLDAAAKAILSKQGNQPETCLELKDSPYAVERSEYWTAREKAQAALEAANVQALLAERDGLAKDKQILTTALIQQSERIAALENERARVGLALFQNGYDNGYTTDGAVEAIELMAARIAELEKQLAEVRGVIEAHDVRLESCDRDGQEFCDCLERVLKSAADALREAGE